MRNKLQLSYSIAVFVGVLLTSYAMMSKEERGARPDAMAVGSPTLRSDASTIDPAVAQLMEIENAIARYRRDSTPGRSPARRRTQTAAPDRTGEVPVDAAHAQPESLLPNSESITVPDP